MRVVAFPPKSFVQQNGNGLAERFVTWNERPLQVETVVKMFTQFWSIFMRKLVIFKGAVWRVAIDWAASHAAVRRRDPKKDINNRDSFGICKVGDLFRGGPISNLGI